ncbi:hypothetical protein SAMN04488056_102154 [Cohaesibacter marisflavi]|uniref:Uncharacterized protein n=1 Tax=Cohaesibacter marisflavi TaxID=655353 RepID=A0A1I5C8N8_9HYPH|nr:hypothetical protein SAMN04488056_102154 [Cohaesibacter marisflavi]
MLLLNVPFFFLKTLKAGCLSGEDLSISAFMPKHQYKCNSSNNFV